MVRSRVAALACGALVCFLPGPGGAVSLTYHWVGAPALVSNFPADDRPLFSTGTIKIEANGSISGKTIRFNSEEQPSDPSYTPVQTRFPINSRFFDHDPDNLSGRLTFDENGEIVDWFISQAYSTSTVNNFRVATDGERFGFRNPYFDISEQVYSRVLKEKGYVRGTQDYDRLASGCWAGEPGEECDDGVWSALLLSNERGNWVKDDPSALSELIDRTAALALKNPPRSYYDIPPAPIPIPAPFLLLAVAVGSLAVAAARKERSQTA